MIFNLDFFRFFTIRLIDDLFYYTLNTRIFQGYCAVDGEKT